MLCKPGLGQGYVFRLFTLPSPIPDSGTPKTGFVTARLSLRPEPWGELRAEPLWPRGSPQALTVTDSKCFCHLTFDIHLDFRL